MAPCSFCRLYITVHRVIHSRSRNSKQTTRAQAQYGQNNEDDILKNDVQ